MNLTALVLDKIQELGATKGAKYFGVSVPTIYLWKKKGNPPTSAVQKVLDDNESKRRAEIKMQADAILKAFPESEGPYGDKTIKDYPQPEAEVDPAVVAGEQAVAEQTPVPEYTYDFLQDVKYRLEKLEMAVATQYDAARATRKTSLINPLGAASSPPNSGMVMTSSPKIIGEVPKPADAPAGWNDAKPAPTNSGWNAPIKKQDPAREGGWNAPMPKKQE